LSEGKIGKTWVFVDIGLCALFGSSFLSMVNDVFMTAG
jgi:hypothetical protein